MKSGLHALCWLMMSLLITSVALAETPSELVFAFQKQKDPAKIQQEAETLAAELTGRIGIPVQVMVPQDYSAAVQALVSRKADIVYTDSMPFLLARRDGNASLLLAEQRPDVVTGQLRTDYDSVFVVRADSPLQSFEDVLRQSRDLRMVFTSPTSTSGYIMAYYRMVKEGLLQPRQDPQEVFKSIAYGGGYSQALEQLLQDRGDIAAVSNYVMDGPRSGVYLTPEQRQQLRVLTRTPGVPTHVVIARDGLDDDLKTRIKKALIAIAAEQPQLIGDVYGASAFVEVDPDEHTRAVVEAVEYLGLPLGEIGPKK
jgi:phosphonate transport system substrate-binding protein